jgi:hypothetical protein
MPENVAQELTECATQTRECARRQLFGQQLDE